MQDSVTYQAIVEQGKKVGKADEACDILVRLGTERFGKPSSRVLAKLKKMSDKDALEDLVMRTLIVSNWNELLK